MFRTIFRLQAVANNLPRANSHKPGLLPIKTLARTMAVLAKGYDFETLKVTVPAYMVYNVEMNRPEKRNAMTKGLCSALKECFNRINSDPECRVVVLSGAGNLFSAGIDLADFANDLIEASDMDVGRKAMAIRNLVPAMQDSFTSMEKCLKPVIAAVHSACIGAGVDMVTACDMRYCSQDAWFQIKEVDLGLAADVGTLQRLPKIVGNDSLVRELCYTARKLHSDEAKDCGLVSRIFQDRDSLIAGALETASLIASKSPIAVQGTKASLVYSRDHTVEDGLNNVATWNQAMLQSEDVATATMAFMQKEMPKFSKL